MRSEEVGVCFDKDASGYWLFIQEISTYTQLSPVYVYVPDTYISTL
jgi:hypothetical protein